MKKTKVPKRWKENTLEKELKEVLMVCTLKTAHFSMDETENQIIKDKIRLWVTSWIVNPIETVLESVE